eukprot:scaffold1769_cov164-Ochromonas_danica.AAC.2
MSSKEDNLDVGVQQPAASLPTASSAVTAEEVTPVPEEALTPAEKLRKEKQEEINALRAKEVFETRETGRYECQSCGYIYDESKGYEKKGIEPGTPWNEIERFRCPNCGASKKYFVQETETVSGFKDNMKYGFGGNSMTSGQKNLFIFGGLLATFLLFLSGYLLE